MQDGEKVQDIGGVFYRGCFIGDFLGFYWVSGQQNVVQRSPRIFKNMAVKVFKNAGC